MYIVFLTTKEVITLRVMVCFNYKREVEFIGEQRHLGPPTTTTFSTTLRREKKNIYLYAISVSKGFGFD